MPQQTDAALAIAIASITPELVMSKLRVVGRLQGYDEEAGVILLEAEGTFILVDISLSLNPKQSYPWLFEQNTIVSIIGYLESLPESSKNEDDEDDGSMPWIIRAIAMKDVSELDLQLWNRALESRRSRECSIAASN